MLIKMQKLFKHPGLTRVVHSSLIVLINRSVILRIRAVKCRKPRRRANGGSQAMELSHEERDDDRFIKCTAAQH